MKDGVSKARAARLLRWMGLDWSGVADPRKARGKRHSHTGMMSLMVAAFATTQANVLRHVEDFCTDIRDAGRRALGLVRGAVSDTALYALLARQTAAGMADVVERQIKKALASKAIGNDLFPWGVMSFDGKQAWFGRWPAHALCREHAPETGPRGWSLFALKVSLVSSSARPCVYQLFIPGKTNEVASFAEVFGETERRYARSYEFATGDAGLNSRANAAPVDAAHKAYMLAVKENQPGVWMAARERLGCKEMPGDAQLVGEIRTVDRYRGHDVTRDLFRCHVDAADPGIDFPTARELWRVRQVAVQTDGDGRETRRTVEDRYFVVNRVLKARHALQLVRLHWGIENGTNRTLDTQLAEDDGSPCTAGEALLVVSWLRVLAYNLVSMWRRHLPRAHGDETSWDRAGKLLRDAFVQVLALDPAAPFAAAFPASG